MMQPFEECPQFESCSCNVCPLDPDVASKVALPAEEQCGARRSTRVAIAARHPLELLPMGGLTAAEVARDKRRAAAKTRWEALSPEQRARLVPFKRKALAQATSDLSQVLEPKTPAEGQDSGA